MSDIFASDAVFKQHEELRNAFTDWIAGQYPHAKTIGQVVLWRRQDEIIDGARYGFEEVATAPDDGEIDA
jgi:hypothetical protein